MNDIQIFDNVLPDPEAYRAEAMKSHFRTYDFEGTVFHGIAVGKATFGLVKWISGKFPDLECKVSFFRRSPLNQVEPHFIHSDVDMGDWSCLLYLNPDPPVGDGTSFWTHRATGAHQSAIPHERSEEGLNVANWDLRQHVQAVFNRVVMFRSSCFHSRAIPENYGEGEGARLTQVVFGAGSFDVSLVER